MNTETGKRILVSHGDRERLRELVSAELAGRRGLSAQYLQILLDELRQACVMTEKRMPRDVVALGARVQIEDLDIGQTLRVMPVLPADAIGGERLSVLSPLGMALFGYRAGDRIDWGPVDRLIRFRIERVSR